MDHWLRAFGCLAPEHPDQQDRRGGGRNSEPDEAPAGSPIRRDSGSRYLRVGERARQGGDDAPAVRAGGQVHHGLGPGCILELSGGETGQKLVAGTFGPRLGFDLPAR